MADSKLRIIRREDMVVIAINGKTSVNFPDFTGCQFIRIHMSPAVINQIFAILRPVGRFNDVVKLLEDST